MSRKTFKDFRIKELDGGLNLENSPNEINDKQCLEALNYSFSGNKLINSKDVEQMATFSFQLDGWVILWLDVIDGIGYFPVQKWWSWIIMDLHYFTEQSDWSAIYTNKINTSARGCYIDVVVPWTTYTLEVDGVWFVDNTVFSYTAVGWDTKIDVYNSLKSQINSSSFYIATKGEYKDELTLKEALFVWAFAWFDLVLTETNFDEIFYDYFILWTLTPTSKTFKSWNDLVVLSGSNAYYLQEVSDGSSWWISYNVQKIRDLTTTNEWIWTYYNGKLLLWDSGNNILYFSKTATPTEPYNVKNFQEYSSGFQLIWWDGLITWLITWEKGVYVFKEDEVYYSNSVQDDGISFNFVFNRITNNWAWWPQMIERVSQDIFYYDKINRKIRRLSYEQNLTTLRDTNLSDEIDELIFSLPILQNYTRLKYNYPNLKVYMQSDPVLNANDECFVYNVDRKSWSTKDDEPLKWGYGRYLFKEDNTIWYDWTSYSNSWTFFSKEYDMWDAIDEKKYGEIEVYWKVSDDVTLLLDVYIDWELVSTDELKNDWTFTNDVFRTRIDMYEQWRYIQFKFRYTGIGYLEINEVNIRWKPTLAFSTY